MLGLQEERFCAYLQSQIPETSGLCLHNLFCCYFLESFSFSLDGFSEAASEAEHGPPTHALLGLPLFCIAREIGSKAFCYLCCMENGSFSVCDNLNHPCLISFFTATVIPQPVPRFLFLEINHFLDLSSVGCAPSLFLSDDNSHSSAQHISLSPASAPGHSLPSQAAEGWQG